MMALPWTATVCILGVVFAQAFGLCATLYFAGKSRSRRPVTALLTGYAFNAVAAMAIAVLCWLIWEEEPALAPALASLATGAVACLVWYAPVMFSLIAVRRTYTVLRLLAGLGIGWGAVILVAVGVAYALTGSPELVLSLAPVALIFTSLYPVAFLVFLLTSPWCREGVIRTYGLDRERPQPPPLPG
jgi:hypothetical protein